MDCSTAQETGDTARLGNGARGSRARIVVAGNASSWLEGVVDLLQLAGYDTVLLTDWSQAEKAILSASADLAIVDLSDYLDSLDLPDRLGALTSAGGLPILLLNSTGDDRIWHLQRVGSPNRGRVDFYAHSLLGPTALLDKVTGCLGPRLLVPAG
ncbi:MAG TPA: hypothetical protein PKO09_09475 [Anaerolineae bacterium]|nr:hypothetical protein [Anaerolineae bacterium]